VPLIAGESTVLTDVTLFFFHSFKIIDKILHFRRSQPFLMNSTEINITITASLSKFEISSSRCADHENYCVLESDTL
jgi:hypothetical protein